MYNLTILFTYDKYNVLGLVYGKTFIRNETWSAAMQDGR